MNLRYFGLEDGLFCRAATMPLDTTTKAAYTSGGAVAVIDKAVTLTDDDTVGFGSEGDTLFGKIVQVEKDGMVTVQLEGVMILPGKTGDLPTLGSVPTVDGAGNLCAPETAVAGRSIVTSVDATNKLITVLI